MQKRSSGQPPIACEKGRSMKVLRATRADNSAGESSPTSCSAPSSAPLPDGLDASTAPESSSDASYSEVHKSASGTKPPTEGGTSWVTATFLLIFGFGVAIAGAELVFRTAEPFLTPAPWFDRPSQYYLPESSMEGRDFYYPPLKPPSTFRIAVIGDSFTFGGAAGQFDDNFVKRLERMLNLNTSQRKVEVMNWGTPGFSTAQEATLVHRAVQSYSPDLVIVQVTLNDPELKPYRATHSFQNTDGSVNTSAGLFQYSHIARFMYQRFANTMLQKEYVKYYYDLFQGRDTWNRFIDATEQIRNDTATHRVPVIFVVFPMFSHPVDDDYPFTDIHKQLDDMYASKQIRFLDLLSSFKNIPVIRLQAIPGKDSHPNEIAHRIAADAIYQRLLADQLIPEDIRIKKLKRLRRLSRALPRIRPEDLNALRASRTRTVTPADAPPQPVLH